MGQVLSTINVTISAALVPIGVINPFQYFGRTFAVRDGGAAYRVNRDDLADPRSIPLARFSDGELQSMLADAFRAAGMAAGTATTTAATAISSKGFAWAASALGLALSSYKAA